MLGYLIVSAFGKLQSSPGHKFDAKFRTTIEENEWYVILFKLLLNLTFRRLGF